MKLKSKFNFSHVDHVQITALTRALKVNIRVAYLDGHDTDGNVNFVDFQSVPPEDFQDPPVLLYRQVFLSIYSASLLNDVS